MGAICYLKIVLILEILLPRLATAYNLNMARRGIDKVRAHADIAATEKSMNNVLLTIASDDPVVAARR
jgi:hypothetical protein